MSKKKYSVFSEIGINDFIPNLLEEIKELYLEDTTPWIIGYSGGKDSSTIVQLVWMAISELPESERHKPVHIITTDTQVENPVVSAWVARSHALMLENAKKFNLPIIPHRLFPSRENSFWVNLIGKGYPAPRNKFRWCTDRLKIAASNTFINSVVKDNGQAMLLLGTRKFESQARRRVMLKHEKGRFRDRISPNSSMPGTLVYTCIEDWSNDDVWIFLMQYKNPWGFDNKELLTMYQGASSGGECPLIVDASTPSCGDSRFGCWVCTIVDKDKSMHAMIQNDTEKEWMYPLLEFRNKYLDFRPSDGNKEEQTDRSRRDFRRMGGNITLYKGRAVHGPYTQEARIELLKELLKAEIAMKEIANEKGISEAKNIELITFQELEDIRRIWVFDKHEIEDVLPEVYFQATGKKYKGKALNEKNYFSKNELSILKNICENPLEYEMIRDLLDIERKYRTMNRRSGLFSAIDKAIERNFFENETDAVNHSKQKLKLKEDI